MPVCDLDPTDLHEYGLFLVQPKTASKLQLFNVDSMTRVLDSTASGPICRQYILDPVETCQEKDLRIQRFGTQSKGFSCTTWPLWRSKRCSIRLIGLGEGSKLDISNDSFKWTRIEVHGLRAQAEPEADTLAESELEELRSYVWVFRGSNWCLNRDYLAAAPYELGCEHVSDIVPLERGLDGYLLWDKLCTHVLHYSGCRLLGLGSPRDCHHPS
ncbi:hypothetical protein C8R44DRAFT_735313 [Mycena epipterygia]|nr:hypothetical protein C8R44DRAFT_735313 [Mycena epipterygia]